MFFYLKNLYYVSYVFFNVLDVFGDSCGFGVLDGF